MIADPVSVEMLRRAIAELASIHQSIVALDRRTDDGWRRELIALRRRLQQQTQTVTTFVETLDPNRDETRRLRAALGRMRTGVALHQASWPAVAIDRTDPRYRDSVVGLRAAYKDFVALAETILPRR